jgi:hypothetical protein
MEAENYSAIIQKVDSTWWELINEPEDFSGTGAMQAIPQGSTVNKTLSVAQQQAPVLEFSTNFVKAESVYVWARAGHTSGYDDSFWIGIDDEIVQSPENFTTSEQPNGVTDWYWLRWKMDNNRATVNVATTGVHVFKAYFREGFFKLDKILLTTDELYIPDGHGPDETLAPTGVELSKLYAPLEFKLCQNYPNPFNPTTTIIYSLPNESSVDITITDLLGRAIKSFTFNAQSAGYRKVVWDGTNSYGNPVSSGIYVYRVTAISLTNGDRVVKSAKMNLLK